MARYMIEFSYTADAWAALVREPSDRSAGMDKLARAYGGQLVEAYYSFSDVDGVVLFDVPDYAAASGVALTALAQGHIKAYKMIPLLSPSRSCRQAARSATWPPARQHGRAALDRNAIRFC